MVHEPKQPQGHGNRWLRGLVIGLAVGAVLAYVVMSRARRPNAPLGIAVEKYIPPQTLRLLDGNMQDFGELQILTNGGVMLSLWDAENEPLIDFAAIETVMLTIHQRQSESSHLSYLVVLMEPEPSFSMSTPDGKHFSTPSKSRDRHSFPAALAISAYHGFFPEKPETRLDEVVPSEDLRLVNRNHELLAVLGLSEAGEPSIALTHSDGRLLAVLSITSPDPLGLGGPKEWPTLVLYDRHGSQRVEVDLGPDATPAVMISEKSDPKNPTDLGAYALDPQSGKEVSVGLFDHKAAAIPWLSHAMRRIPLPVVVVDERGQALWRTH